MIEGGEVKFARLQSGGCRVHMTLNEMNASMATALSDRAVESGRITRMKFSLKHLIIFVTIAAMFCGLIGYTYNRLRLAEQAAVQDQALIDRAIYQAKVEQARLLSRNRDMSRDLLRDKPGNNREFSIIHLNVESGGNDSVTIEEQLIDLGQRKE